MLSIVVQHSHKCFPVNSEILFPPQVKALETENVFSFIMNGNGFFSGFDVIAQAQSGTGKTATFSIAILEKIDVSLTGCQALVLAPTRELAQQV